MSRGRGGVSPGSKKAALVAATVASPNLAPATERHSLGVRTAT